MTRVVRPETGWARLFNVGRLVRERPVLFVFVVALMARLAAILVGHVFLPGDFLAVDDDTYFAMATQAVDGSSADWGTGLRGLSRSVAAFVLPLTAIVHVVGPSRLAVNVFVALLGATTAGLTTVLGSKLANRRAGLVAGLLVAMLPSQVAWSSTTLKDPLVWALEVGVVVAVVSAIQNARFRIPGLVLAAAGLFALCFTRLHSAVVLGWALVIAGVWLWRRWGPRPVGMALALAILVPWMAGAGPGGLHLAREAPTPSTQRILAAQGADSAIDELSTPSSTTGPVSSDTAEPASTEHDEGPVGWVLSEELSHLPRGYAVMFLEPYPWEERNDARFLLAKVDTFLWYPLVALGGFGSYLSLRQARLATIIVIVVFSIATMFALFEGNLGTAFRHRGELVWGVALLSAIGWERVRPSASEAAH